MEFGWINIFGAIIVILMLIPNIIYGITNKDEKNICTNRFMTIAEQIGSYACIVIMWLPLLECKFGFDMKHITARRALILALLPACIFLISGVLLRHWLLVGFAVLFAIGHIYVTYQSAAQIKDRS